MTDVASPTIWTAAKQGDLESIRAIVLVATGALPVGAIHSLAVIPIIASYRRVRSVGDRTGTLLKSRRV